MRIKPLFLMIIAASWISITLTTQVLASEKVDELKNAIARKGAAWVAAENWITKLTTEEKHMLCGALPVSREYAESRFMTLQKTGQLPAKFDWRNNSGNWVTPVKNQGNCGSCWDFSAIAQVESWWKIHNNYPDSLIDLSEQFVLSCTEGSCDGWQVSYALDFIRDTGVPTESCFAYEADDEIPCSDACENWTDEVVKIPGWGFVTLDEAIIDIIKEAVYRHPVSASYTVYDDFYYYNSGVYEPVSNVPSGAHAILIVGWDDELQCWICKNSWGENWGEDGYFRIKWGECGMGENIPFIWNTTISGPALSVDIENIELDVVRGDSVYQAEITLYNSSEQVLEYSVVDYEVPVAFHPDDFIPYEDDYAWWCADDYLLGYDNHWLQYLETPMIDLSESENPLLNYMGYWMIEDPQGATDPWDGWDGYNVWLSADGGATFNVAVPTSPSYNCQSLWSFGHESQGWNFGPGIPGWGGSTEDWTPVEFDLSNYKSDSVIIRFAFASDLAWCTEDDAELVGLLLDEIKVLDGDSLLFYDTANDITAMRRQGYGVYKADWINLVNGMGTIDPFDSTKVQIAIGVADLQPGSYTGRLKISSNDTMAKSIEIDINLAVKNPVKIGDKLTNLPAKMHLSQNYPNPFNPQTVIQYELATPGEVEITVFDISGQKVATLISAKQTAGSHKVLWDGKDGQGRKVSSGMYFYTLKTGAKLLSRQMILLK